MSIELTKNYERHRIRNPKLFIESSFRTHDIGRKGYSKRISGRLKKSGKWATQSILISRKESPSMKKKLRESSEIPVNWSDMGNGADI
jgi:hypothetical protein